VPGCHWRRKSGATALALWQGAAGIPKGLSWPGCAHAGMISSACAEVLPAQEIRSNCAAVAERRRWDFQSLRRAGLRRLWLIIAKTWRGWDPHAELVIVYKQFRKHQWHIRERNSIEYDGVGTYSILHVWPWALRSVRQRPRAAHAGLAGLRARLHVQQRLCRSAAGAGNPEQLRNGRAQCTVLLEFLTPAARWPTAALGCDRKTCGGQTYWLTPTKTTTSSRGVDAVLEENRAGEREKNTRIH